MAIYSISDLEKISGIKSHTLRVWEQRYGILHPKRTPTNIRYYEDDDLQLILNIALLNRHGYKISKIAAMSKKDLVEKVNDVSEVKLGLDAELDVLTIAVIEMDEYKFSRILDNHIKQMGFEETMIEIVYPFMEKLSLLWLTGSIKPVQENFIALVIRNKLIAAIEDLAPADRDVDKFLLYLPKGEQQELSLLFMQYLVKKRGFQAINIGPNMAVVDLKDACAIHHPSYIFTILSETFNKEPVQRYLQNLSEARGDSQLLLTGYLVASQSVQMPENTKVLPSLGDAIEFLDSLVSKN